MEERIKCRIPKICSANAIFISTKVLETNKINNSDKMGSSNLLHYKYNVMSEGQT